MAATANPRARLEHILFHIQGIAETMRGVSFDEFKDVYHLERTVERAAQIISEAVRALPPELLKRHPEIEWSKITALGNVLRHEYQQIDPEIMWDIATAKLPEMEPVIRTMLAEVG
ncbi:MAG: HepT-like ribonuclease domain-containing protein [Xanthobacteraceae bacterium]